VAASRPPTRLSYGAVAAGVGGLLLILSLFLDWIGQGSFGASAFDLLSIMDIFLLLVGLAAVAFAAIEAFGLQVNLPVNRVRALTVLGTISASFVWGLLVESDHIKFGFILAALSAGAILFGGILAERSPNLGVANPAAAGGPLAGMTQGGGSGAPPAAATPAATPAQPVQPVQPAQPAAQAPAGGGAAAAAPAGGAGAKADWYPDPRGEKRLRYWDGSQWTDHTAD
jgi:hypothetical protein